MGCFWHCSSRRRGWLSENLKIVMDDMDPRSACTRRLLDNDKG